MKGIHDWRACPTCRVQKARADEGEAVEPWSSGGIASPPGDWTAKTEPGRIESQTLSVEALRREEARLRREVSDRTWRRYPEPGW